MSELKKGDKCLVWDNGCDQYIGIFVAKFNSVYVVYDADNNSFDRWDNCEPIPEPETRHLTDVEIFQKLVGKAVFRRCGREAKIMSLWSTEYDIEEWDYCLISDLNNPTWKELKCTVDGELI